MATDLSRPQTLLRFVHFQSKINQTSLATLSAMTRRYAPSQTGLDFIQR